MADVVEQGGHPDDLPPVLLPPGFQLVGDSLPDRIRDRHVEDRAEDPIGYLHHAEGILEPLVSRAGIDLVAHRELMDAPQALEWRRID